MKKLKVVSVFGTRPEAAKMAPLLLALRACGEVDSVCCVSGQHREMLQSVLDLFHITPDFDLEIMQQGQTLGDITSRVLGRLDPVLAREQPDLVLVHGDTSTTFSAALAAFYRQIPVGHVEAGLRSFNRYSPFPEEMNRLLVSRLASLYFCPTRQNRRNLEAEGIRENLYITGNTAIDSVKMIATAPYAFRTPELRALDFERKRVILLTAHRRENYGEPLRAIFRAVRAVCAAAPDVEVVYPVHLSPVVRETAHEVLGDVPQAHLIDPLPLDENLNLMRRSYFVMTDSGGIQEEAPALGRPVLVLRRETERPEAIEAGTVALAGVEEAEVFAQAMRLLTDPAAYAKMARAANPYGDGRASERIVQAILHHFGRGEAPENFQPRA